MISGDLFGGSPLADTIPPWDHADHPETVPSDFFGQKNLPYPTNVWWQNMVLNEGKSVAAALPYLVKTTDSGFHVNLPGKVRKPRTSSSIRCHFTTRTNTFQVHLIFLINICDCLIVLFDFQAS